MSEAPRYTVKSIRAYERPVHMRLPFRFGDTIVRNTAEVFVAVTLEGRDSVVEGYAAQLMVPRWFDKRPHLSNDDTVAELRETVQAAAKHGAGLSGTVRGLSTTLRTKVLAAMPEGTPRLAAGFGPAVIEMALIDAACRDHALSFATAARKDVFGLVEDSPPDLPPERLRDHLAGLTPRWDIAIRHTVGYDAPLTPGEVDQRPPDKLPVALSEVVAATGISNFKIKLKGDPDADIARLSDISAVLAGSPDYAATLDANEQYDPENFTTFLAQFGTDPRLVRMREATLFVEQPFARDIALAATEMRLPDSIPLVIDESDDDDDVFPRAAAIGWAGVSVKSCKGVLRALLNSARVAAFREAGRPALLSAEDLTCQPGLCWQQDTTMAATVGATHVERNGHHFAGGLQGASDKEIKDTLAAHSDLYAALPNGRPTLRIEQGRVHFSSLNSVGFSSDPAPDFSADTIIAAEEETA